MDAEATIKKINAFFKAPTGTVFLEEGKSGRALYAVKLPVGTDPRYSMVLSDTLWKRNFHDGAVFPESRWSLSLDSFVDNETGKRVMKDPYGDFHSMFNYNEGIALHDAISDVEQAIRDRIRNIPQSTLIELAARENKDPHEAMSLSDEECEVLQRRCHRIFANGEEPLFSADPLDSFHIHTDYQDAQFALSYLKDMDGYVAAQTAENAPSYAAELLHYQAMIDYGKNCLKQIEEHPAYDLVKEQQIKQATKGKSSVWVVFGKGSDTIRLSIPTDCFNNDAALSTWRLRDKDRKTLEQFLYDPEKNYFSQIPIKNIVAMDYKGKSIYRDDAFFDKAGELAKPTFDSMVQSAKNRAAGQQNKSAAKNVEIER